MIRISNLQLFAMIFGSVVSNGILTTPQIAAGIGGPGGWLAVLMYGLLATAALMVLVKLMERFPTDNFIFATEQIIGRVGGCIIGSVVIIYAIMLCAGVVRAMANTSNTTMLQQTPTVVLTGTMLLLCMYVVYQGIEVLARVNLILFTLKLLAIITIILLALPAVRLENLQPLWHRGEETWLNTTLSISGSYHGAIILAFIYQYINRKQRMLLTVAGGMLTVTIVSVAFTVLVIATFGPNETTRMLWPTMSLVRQILTPVEPIFATVWLTSAFTVGSSSLYVAAYAIQYLFRLTDYRIILLPLGILVCTIANTPATQKGVVDFFNYIGFLGILLEWLLPIVLLILAVLFKKKEQSNPEG